MEIDMTCMENVCYYDLGSIKQFVITNNTNNYKLFLEYSIYGDTSLFDNMGNVYDPCNINNILIKDKHELFLLRTLVDEFVSELNNINCNNTKHQERSTHEDYNNCYEEWYKNLGVNEDDDYKTIRKQYLKLSKKYHPDKCKDDKNICKQKFQCINNSHERAQILKNKYGKNTKRKIKNKNKKQIRK